MGKVLISFLGTGPRDNMGKSQREYKKTIYSFDGVESKPTALIADAIMKHHAIDKAIIVGTPHSMWEGLYYNMCESNGTIVDENIFIDLGTYSDNAESKSPLQIPYKDVIESAMGKEVHIELIKYGLNSNEIMENESIILGLEKYLSRGDDLYLDITHSFRSLPLFAMSLIIYLQNVSSKAVNIRSVVYGMFEASSDRIVDGIKMSVTPVVELDSVVKLSEWITGAYSFSHFGNGYRISELMNEEGEKSVANSIAKFSDMLNLNHLEGISKQIQELSAIKNKEFSPLPKMIIPPIVKGFLGTFPAGIKHSTFQFKVAEWHFNHKNYSSSYIALIESIITYVCEEVGYDWSNKGDRDIAKNVLWGRNEGKENQKYVRNFEIVSNTFKRSNNIRISVAHSKETSKNYKDMIDILKNSLSDLKSTIKG